MGVKELGRHKYSSMLALIGHQQDRRASTRLTAPNFFVVICLRHVR